MTISSIESVLGLNTNNTISIDDIESLFKKKVVAVLIINDNNSNTNNILSYK